MAWVKIRSDFYNNPKVVLLAKEMGWSDHHTRGFLCQFWDWCIQHCDSGDFTTVDPDVLGRCLGLSKEETPKLIDALCLARWLDTEPYLRLHDWWDNCGEYLKRKHHKSELWKEIEKAYSCGEKPFTEPRFDAAKIPEAAMKLATQMYQMVKANNPHSIAEEKHIPGWADHIRLLNERDKQPYEVIERVINWCQQDAFWKSNILSGQKLRLQWNKLTARMQQARGGKNVVKPAAGKYSGL